MTTGCGLDRKKHLAGSKVSGSGRVIGHLLTQKIQGSLKLVSRVRESESLLSTEWKNGRCKSVSNNRSLSPGLEPWCSMWKLDKKGDPEGRSLEGSGRWLGWRARKATCMPSIKIWKGYISYLKMLICSSKPPCAWARECFSAGNIEAFLEAYLLLRNNFSSFIKKVP